MRRKVEKAGRAIRHCASLTLSEGERAGGLNGSIPSGFTEQSLWRILMLKAAVKGVLYLPKRACLNIPATFFHWLEAAVKCGFHTNTRGTSECRIWGLLVVEGLDTWKIVIILLWAHLHWSWSLGIPGHSDVEVSLLSYFWFASAGTLSIR